MSDKHSYQDKERKTKTRLIPAAKSVCLQYNAVIGWIILAYLGSEGVWAWGILLCLGRAAGCGEQPGGIWAEAWGPGGLQEAPSWSETVSFEEQHPAAPPCSAAAHPAGDKERPAASNWWELKVLHASCVEFQRTTWGHLLTVPLQVSCE